MSKISLNLKAVGGSQGYPGRSSSVGRCSRLETHITPIAYLAGTEGVAFSNSVE